MKKADKNPSLTITNVEFCSNFTFEKGKKGYDYSSSGGITLFGKKQTKGAEIKAVEIREGKQASIKVDENDSFWVQITLPYSEFERFLQIAKEGLTSFSWNPDGSVYFCQTVLSKKNKLKK